MSQSSVVLSAALFALAACGQPPTTKTAKPSAPNEERVSPRLAAAPSVPVEGWETDPFVFSRIGSTLPAFKSGQPNRPELTQENLRGRWTIRGGSVCLNRFRGLDKWISASVRLRPGLAAAS